MDCDAKKEMITQDTVSRGRIRIYEGKHFSIKQRIKG